MPWVMFLLCCSIAKSCPTLCNPIDYSMPGSSVLYLLEFAQIHVHWVSDSKHLILYCPILLLPSVFPSIRVFSSESALCIRWTKYWSFSFSSIPSNEYWELISFKIDWFYLLAVQGTIKIFTASSPVAYLTSFNLGDSSSSIVPFYFVIMSTRFSRQEYWSGLPYTPPVDHV